MVLYSVPISPIICYIERRLFSSFYFVRGVSRFECVAASFSNVGRLRGTLYPFLGCFIFQSLNCAHGTRRLVLVQRAGFGHVYWGPIELWYTIWYVVGIVRQYRTRVLSNVHVSGPTGVAYVPISVSSCHVCGGRLHSNFSGRVCGYLLVGVVQVGSSQLVYLLGRRL